MTLERAGELRAAIGHDDREVELYAGRGVWLLNERLSIPFEEIDVFTFLAVVEVCDAPDVGQKQLEEVRRLILARAAELRAAIEDRGEAIHVGRGARLLSDGLRIPFEEVDVFTCLAYIEVCDVIG